MKPMTHEHSKITPRTLHFRLLDVERRLDVLDARFGSEAPEVQEIREALGDELSASNGFEIHHNGFGRWQVLDADEKPVHEGWLTKNAATAMVAERTAVVEGVNV